MISSVSQIFDCFLCFYSVFHKLHTIVFLFFYLFYYFKHYGVFYTILTKFQHSFINLFIQATRLFLYNGIQLYYFPVKLIKNIMDVFNMVWVGNR